MSTEKVSQEKWKQFIKAEQHNKKYMWVFRFRSQNHRIADDSQEFKVENKVNTVGVQDQHCFVGLERKWGVSREGS